MRQEPNMGGSSVEAGAGLVKQEAIVLAGAWLAGGSTALSGGYQGQGESRLSLRHAPFACRLVRTLQQQPLATAAVITSSAQSALSFLRQQVGLGRRAPAPRFIPSNHSSRCDWPPPPPLGPASCRLGRRRRSAAPEACWRAGCWRLWRSAQQGPHRTHTGCRTSCFMAPACRQDQQRGTGADLRPAPAAGAVTIGWAAQAGR
jgi:hypothetical protein